MCSNMGERSWVPGLDCKGINRNNKRNVVSSRPCCKGINRSEDVRTKLLLLSCVTLASGQQSNPSGCKSLSKAENHAFHRKAKFDCSVL